jgi:hypothetical protein
MKAMCLSIIRPLKDITRLNIMEDSLIPTIEKTREKMLF